ncbi:MAG: hypothetical protein IT158_11680, partial [Bryobacterales bacterium]|nr:hypothetical protein [Bryobacterales bacterium]
APDPKGALVRLEGLQFRASVPQALTAGQGQVQFQDVGITTDVDLREGQKVVIGKANADAAGSALVLVLTARVME